jgi:hypothetical protein
MQPPVPKIDLRPTKLAKLGSAKPMPVRQQDRSSIPGAIAPSVASGIDQPIDFGLGQILP